ncbi:hypothetical protein F7984_11010 [Pradoshia sp. D12]|nr:hypothetical protein F7984_11010 [Pradoshia sp. D12]TPF73832.1 hypothetical protein FHY44_07410 [Bacillus sp. D12]
MTKTRRKPIHTSLLVSENVSFRLNDKACLLQLICQRTKAICIHIKMTH